MSNSEIPESVPGIASDPLSNASEPVPSADASERVSQAQGIEQYVTFPRDLNDKMYVRLGFEAFRYCSYDIHNLQNSDMNKKRTLFQIGQKALQLLDQTALTRLAINPADIRYDVIEGRPATFGVPSPLYTLVQNQFLVSIRKSYDLCLGMDLTLPDSVPIARDFVASVLDDTTKFLDDDTLSRAISDEDWQMIFYRPVAGVLLHLANWPSQQFGGQSVELFGTRVPATCFA